LWSVGFDETELSERLLSRTAGVEQEATEVGHSPAAAAFSNVGDDGQGRPNQLIAAGEGPRSPEGLGERSAFSGHALRDVGYEEAAGICAEDHTCMIAPTDR